MNRYTHRFSFFAAFIFTALFSLTAQVWAQPAFTYSDYGVFEGDTIHNDRLTDTGAVQTSSGAMQSITIPQLNKLSTDTLIIYKSNSGQFATANLTMVSLKGDTNGYYKISNTETSLVGANNPVGSVNYTDPQAFAFFPMQYQQTIVDTLSGTVDNPSGQTFSRNGTADVTYDGYGSVTIFGQTYNNCVRIHYDGAFDDKLGGTQVTAYEQDNYFWYAKGCGFPVYGLVDLVTLIGGNPTFTITTANHYLPISRGTADTTGGNPGGGIDTSDSATVIIQKLNETPQLALYPNPTNGVLNVLHNSLFKRGGDITITDLNGRAVLREEVTSGATQVAVDVSNLDSGNYTIVLNSPLGLVVERFVIE